MIKLKNSDAIKFGTKTITALLNDNKRRFPVEDALRLVNLVREIQERIRPFQDQYRKIISENGGKLNDLTGSISWKTMEGRQKAEEEHQKIANMVCEYHGNPLKLSKNWPDLSMAEAGIISIVTEKP